MGFKEERFRTGEARVPPGYFGFCDERYDGITAVHNAKGESFLTEAWWIYAD